MQERIKLSQLEQFLMRIADQLRKSMDESEYKEYIFGLLFLKRLSDVFEEKREELRKDYAHLDKPMQDEILEDKGTYDDISLSPSVLAGMRVGMMKKTRNRSPLFVIFRRALDLC